MHEIAELDIVELREDFQTASAGATGGVLDIPGEGRAMVEFTSLPAELGVDRILVVPLDKLRVIEPARRRLGSWIVLAVPAGAPSLVCRAGVRSRSAQPPGCAGRRGCRSGCWPGRRGRASAARSGCRRRLEHQSRHRVAEQVTGARLADARVAHVGGNQPAEVFDD